MLISKDSKIFIAGHSGMVGSAIKRYLIKRGYKKLLCPPKKDLNLLSYFEVNKWFDNNRPEVVILAAAKVGGIYANSKFTADFILDNLKIQNNVIENSWKYKVQRFLFLGSSCIYPKLANQPLKEEYLLTGELEKTNESYAIAKISGIKLCSALKTQYGFDAISLMPTNLYGRGDNYHPANSHVLPSLLRKFYDAKINGFNKVECWGSGNPKREFLYAEDLAEAINFVISNEISEEILNVGSNEEVTIKKLAEIISDNIDYKGSLTFDTSKPDGNPRKLLDSKKIFELGWRPKVKLEKGIDKTYKWFLDNIV